MKKNKYLLVVDMQRGFIDKNEDFLINKINNLYKDYDFIFFTKFINEKNSLYQTQLKWFDLQDEKSQEIVVNIPSNSIVFTKSTYTIKDQDLSLLKEKNISNIDICGVKTDACVYAIAIQLFDNGIVPNILINYTSTLFDKENLTEIFKMNFNKVDFRK